MDYEKLIGAIASLSFGIIFLKSKKELTKQLIEATKKTFGIYSTAREKTASLFVFLLGILFIVVSLILIVQFLKGRFL